MGPGFTIKLVGPDGLPVQRLDPGTYELAVDDRSPEHNFHLSGPGVDVATPVDDVGAQTFAVTLTDGRYTFVCDPHRLTMRGGFDVGTGPAPPPPAPAGDPVERDRRSRRHDLAAHRRPARGRGSSRRGRT